MVTHFQQAVLQEMGIPLWREQSEEATLPGDEPRTVAQPSSASTGKRSENSNNRLAALRQSLSAKPSDDSPVSANRDLSQHESQLAIVSDLRNAAGICGLPQSVSLQVGAELAVSMTHIVLPVSPDKLTATLKRQIWQMMVAQATQ